MSRGRSRHQVSRRRSYSRRQREVRERVAHLQLEERWTASSTPELEEATDPVVGVWRLPAPGRAGAA